MTDSQVSPITRDADVPEGAAEAAAPLLSLRDLRVEYVTERGSVTAVDRLSLDIAPGEVVGLAGESGSGKSTVAQAILRTLGPPAVITGGQILYAGRDVLEMNVQELQRYRWQEVAMVFQSAMNALNPVLSVGEQISDCLVARQGSSADHGDRVDELLQQVGLDPVWRSAYPHQLSGGMRQRVVIAIALALRPRLLIMDEPTTALDVIVQREILQTIATLQREQQFSVLFITHDLSLMFEFTDRLAIAYAGKLAEVGRSADLLDSAAHPYTRGLLDSFPSVRGPRKQLSGIAGNPPNLRALPSGCRFHPRCPLAEPECERLVPELRGIAPQRLVACHLASLPENQTTTLHSASMHSATGSHANARSSRGEKS